MTQVIDFARVGMILCFNESRISSKSQFSGESWMGNWAFEAKGFCASGGRRVKKSVLSLKIQIKRLFEEGAVTQPMKVIFSIVLTMSLHRTTLNKKFTLDTGLCSCNSILWNCETLVHVVWRNNNYDFFKYSIWYIY